MRTTSIFVLWALFLFSTFVATEQTLERNDFTFAEELTMLNNRWPKLAPPPSEAVWSEDGESVMQEEILEEDTNNTWEENEDTPEKNNKKTASGITTLRGIDDLSGNWWSAPLPQEPKEEGGKVASGTTTLRGIDDLDGNWWWAPISQPKEKPSGTTSLRGIDDLSNNPAPGAREEEVFHNSAPAQPIQDSNKLPHNTAPVDFDELAPLALPKTWARL